MSGKKIEVTARAGLEDKRPTKGNQLPGILTRQSSQMYHTLDICSKWKIFVHVCRSKGPVAKKMKILPKDGTPFKGFVHFCIMH